MKYLVTGLLLLGTSQIQAQTWKLNIETGTTLSRLNPSAGSSQRGGSLSYGYSRMGAYIAPEVQLKITDNLDAGFNYQYAQAIVGVQQKYPSTSIRNYDGIDMHSFNLGLTAHRAIFKGRAKAGAFVKGGFSYNKITMVGAGGSSGGDYGAGVSNAPTYSGINRPSGFEAMSGAWTPTTTVGLSIGTNSKRWIADRLSFRWSATMNWVNTYDSYSYYDYSVSSNNISESGRVRYQGIPFVMQFGVNYRIAGFGGRG